MYRNDDRCGAAAAVRNSELQEIDMLNRKPLIIAAVAAATVGVTALSSHAHANDDALLGAVVGAGIGAAIGHNVHGHDGAVVGGANSQYGYDSGYYAVPATVYAPAPVYYGDAPAYYQAAPVYYPHPRFNYRPRFEYAPYYDARYVDHGRPHDRDRRHPDWHGNEGHHGR
jgi:hypothetical protein